MQESVTSPRLLTVTEKEEIRIERPSQSLSSSYNYH